MEKELNKKGKMIDVEIIVYKDNKKYSFYKLSDIPEKVFINEKIIEEEIVRGVKKAVRLLKNPNEKTEMDVEWEITDKDIKDYRKRNNKNI